MSITELLQQGAASAWFFIPTAILLGALHGLEPGHSKSMMAAFIVAIRGTVWQAVMLAIAATVSHTAIVWAIALLAMAYGSRWSAETTEPYFQLASAVVIVGIAAWMAVRAWRDIRRSRAASAAAHPHGAPGHGDHTHASDVDVMERGHGHAPHVHPHPPSAGQGSSAGNFEAQDAHARAHTADLRQRFAGRTVTTGQVVLFGLTGGLLPCPGAVTVALLCLQLERFSLGIVLVLCFSVGLALTLVASGIFAAVGMRHAARRWPGLDDFMRRLPFVSCALIGAIGLYVGYEGLTHLPR